VSFMLQLADLVSVVSMTKLVGVERRATKSCQCAYACALLATNQTTQHCPTASAHRQRQLIAVFLPERAAPRRIAVIVIGASAVRIAPHSHRRARAIVGIVGHSPRRSAGLSIRAAGVAIVKALPVSCLLLRCL